MVPSSTFLPQVSLMCFLSDNSTLNSVLVSWEGRIKSPNLLIAFTVVRSTTVTQNRRFLPVEEKCATEK